MPVSRKFFLPPLRRSIFESLGPKATLHRATTKVPVVSSRSSIFEIKRMFEKYGRFFDSLQYIYILNKKKKLVQILSFKDLYHHNPATPLREISTGREIISVLPDASQEKAVQLALKHGVKAMPVVDREGGLLGVIPGNTLLSILYKEAREDILHLAGVHPSADTFDEVTKMSVWKSLRHRLPWLILGLLGGVFMANVIQSFESTLQKNLILAAFIPLIVYMNDAVQTQMEAFIIRDLAVERSLKFGFYFVKQFLVVVCLAIIFSFFLFFGGAFFYHDLFIGAILGISLFLGIVSSVVSGLIVPYVFSRFRIDPANTSGPIATIIQDTLSIVIYFTVATWIL